MIRAHVSPFKPACTFRGVGDKNNGAELVRARGRQRQTPLFYVVPTAFARPLFFTQKPSDHFFFLSGLAPGNNDDTRLRWRAWLGQQVCVCYTSDLQTSPIFTVDYYKGVAKSAAEAGAHMIGIKVSVSEQRLASRVPQPALHGVLGSGEGARSLVGSVERTTPLSPPILFLRRRRIVCPRTTSPGARRKTTAPLTSLQLFLSPLALISRHLLREPRLPGWWP